MPGLFSTGQICSESKVASQDGLTEMVWNSVKNSNWNLEDCQREDGTA